MKACANRLAVALLAWVALGICGCATSGRQAVPNLAIVAPGIYRGGQPTAEGWQAIMALGVTNVVKLNAESEGSDAEAERLGAVVHRLPISGWEQMCAGVPRERLEAACELLTPGTYVHCLHGQDRTGLVVAMYRLRSGWTPEQAEAEMLRCGFHPLLVGLWRTWVAHRQAK